MKSIRRVWLEREILGGFKKRRKHARSRQQQYDALGIGPVKHRRDVLESNVVKHACLDILVRKGGDGKIPSTMAILRGLTSNGLALTESQTKWVEAVRYLTQRNQGLFPKLTGRPYSKSLVHDAVAFLLAAMKHHERPAKDKKTVWSRVVKAPSPVPVLAEGATTYPADFISQECNPMVSMGSDEKTRVQHTFLQEFSNETAMRQLRLTSLTAQVTGIYWLWKKLTHGEFKELGRLITDYCGSGKTVIVIGLLLQIQREERKRFERGRTLRAKPSMLVMPSGIAESQREKISTLAPGLRLERYYGTHRVRIVRADFEVGGEFDPTKADTIDIIISTTYSSMGQRHPVPTPADEDEQGSELAVSDLRRCIDTLILDEAHLIKAGSAGKRARAIIKLEATRRIAFTATPFFNTIGDTRGLLEFIQIPPSLEEEDRGVAGLSHSHSFGGAASRVKALHKNNDPSLNMKSNTTDSRIDINDHDMSEETESVISDDEEHATDAEDDPSNLGCQDLSMIHRCTRSAFSKFILPNLTACKL